MVLLLLICLLFFSYQLLGLSPDITPDQCLQRLWTTKDGLPQTSVTSLVFDKKGYLWISTFGGVVRFNGRDFEYLEVPDPRVTKLFIDRDENLWMGTENGFIFKKEKDNIWSTSIPQKNAVVRDLLLGRDGFLYVATDIGLWILKNGKWEYLKGFEDPQCRVLLESDGGIYIGTKKGLYFLKDGVLKKEGMLFEDKQINAVRKDKMGRLWVGTINGVYKKEKGKWSAYYFSKKYFLKFFNTIFEDRNGILWFNSAGNLFLKLDLQRNITTPFYPRGISEWVYCPSIVEDPEGSMWFGTSGGLLQLSEGLAITLIGEDKSLDIPIRSIMKDDDGGIYFSFMHCFGVGYFKENKVRTFKELDGICFYSMAKDGDVILAGSQDGLYVKREKSEKFLKQDLLEGETILSILPLKDKILFGTNNGLFIFDKNKKEGKFQEAAKNKKILL